MTRIEEDRSTPTLWSSRSRLEQFAFNENKLIPIKKKSPFNNCSIMQAASGSNFHEIALGHGTMVNPSRVYPEAVELLASHWVLS